MLGEEASTAFAGGCRSSVVCVTIRVCHPVYQTGAACTDWLGQCTRDIIGPCVVQHTLVAQRHAVLSPCSTLIGPCLHPGGNSKEKSGVRRRRTRNSKTNEGEKTLGPPLDLFLYRETVPGWPRALKLAQWRVVYFRLISGCCCCCCCCCLGVKVRPEGVCNLLWK